MGRGSGDGGASSTEGSTDRLTPALPLQTSPWRNPQSHTTCHAMQPTLQAPQIKSRSPWTPRQGRWWLSWTLHTTGGPRACATACSAGAATRAARPDARAPPAPAHAQRLRLPPDRRRPAHSVHEARPQPNPTQLSIWLALPGRHFTLSTPLVLAALPCLPRRHAFSLATASPTLLLSPPATHSPGDHPRRHFSLSVLLCSLPGHHRLPLSKYSFPPASPHRTCGPARGLLLPATHPSITASSSLQSAPPPQALRTEIQHE